MTLRATKIGECPRKLLRRPDAASLFAALIAVLSLGFAGCLALADDESRVKSEIGAAIAPIALNPSDRDRELIDLSSHIPADHPRGTRARVTPLSLERTSNLHNPILSTFLIKFAPGGSAVLHHAPASGYVLVHVLSGSITASAWGAGVGMYRAGQTWAEPAFAYDVSTSNASTREPAEALVVLIIEEVR